MDNASTAFDGQVTNTAAMWWLMYYEVDSVALMLLWTPCTDIRLLLS